MGRQLGIHPASPARGCVSFRLKLYVESFNSRPETYGLTHADLSMISRQVASYPISLINMFISGGLLYIHLHPEHVSVFGWNPPFRAHTAVVWFFFASNVFLVVVPFVPPAPGYKVFEHLPYYVSELHCSSIRARVPREPDNQSPRLPQLHCVVGLAIGFLGFVYWYVKVVYLPRRGGYKLETEEVVEDGISRTVFRQVPL